MSGLRSLLIDTAQPFQLRRNRWVHPGAAAEKSENRLEKIKAKTPLMEQYLAIKRQHKDAILFFRMGDFYEMFYEDAKTGSRVLGITLTSRAHGKSADVPLAGFPHHALDSYLARMVRAGHRVAICEQIEDPKLAKTVVKREVLEVVTPGTTIADELLETKRNNYLLALYLSGTNCGVARVDVSTGEFQAAEVAKSAVREQVLSLEPAEILLCESQREQLLEQLEEPRPFTVTCRDDWSFQYDYAYETLTDHFGTLSMRGFGLEEMTAAVAAAGAVIVYLRENQREKLVHINRISRLHDAEAMIIDSTTRRNLELIRPMNDSSASSTLLSVLDRTVTPMGGRQLVSWLLSPLLQPDRINQRLDAVGELCRESGLRNECIDALKQAGDLERLLAKFVTGRANARDALAVLATLRVTARIRDIMAKVKSARLRALSQEGHLLSDLAAEIERAVVDQPPLSITEGGIFRPGYNEELDELREIAYSGKDWIARLQKSEREKTGIPSLKVNYNKVFGYYIEVTKPHLARVPPHYTRKQTLVNAERFIIQELKEYEEKILGAEEKMASLEYDLFNALRQEVMDQAEKLQDNARRLARIDVFNSLAAAAVDNDYSRPVVDLGNGIEIRDGRHPVVERLLPLGESFVANDTKIDSERDQILIVTGPNMAGKSTYLRQVGLIVILAQMGSFVPARKAIVGAVDRLFTRVGASDNLAAGTSTFLNEMNETANILNNATPRSLILLDEIGRGTSTFDGLSIAWSVAEYLHNTPRVAAKTIFATHYHELTELERVLARVKNYNVAVREWDDQVVFLRKIVPGGCDHSYGIHVAQLAGLPEGVILRAREVLQNLESEALNAGNVPKLAQHRGIGRRDRQMNLFVELEKSLRRELSKIDPNQLTPLDALKKLDELKQLADE